MSLEAELPPEIAAEVEAAEVEALRAVAPVAVSPKPRKPGRPPKGACAACGEPLAVGKVCPCWSLKSPPPDLNIPRPAWEPLPLEDLRERLTVLAQSGVESYEDGAIKITINQQARLAGVVKQEDRRARW
jgi:hypothetical protein